MEYQIQADPTAHSQIAFKNNGLGILMRRLGKPTRPRGFYRTAIQEYFKIPAGDQTGEVKTWAYNLGKLLSSRGKPNEAREWLERSLQIHIDIDIDIGDESHVGIGLIKLSLANLLRDEGKFQEAHERYRGSLAELEQIDPPAPHFIAAARVSYGASLSRSGELYEADKFLVPALETARALNGRGQSFTLFVFESPAQRT